MKFSKSLMKVAKNVIKNLAEMGIDGAGQFVCGARWDFFKKVLSPVIDALAERFPDLLDKTETAGKAMNELESASDLRTLLEEEYQKHFTELEEGHKEINRILLQQSDLLISLKGASERGAKELAKIGSNVEEALDLLREKHAGLSISGDEVTLEIDSLQRDAMGWIEKKRFVSAQRRLDDARNIIRNEIDNKPQDIRLLTLRGYVEKSQGQVHLFKGEVDQALNALETAANYFGAAHKAEEKDPSALNGLANIYFYLHDFDTAARFSTMALKEAPDYAEAAWDLALALEMKLRRGDSDKDILPRLVPCYEMLAAIIPKYPGFTATQLKHVQTRLAKLKGSAESTMKGDSTNMRKGDARSSFSIPSARDALFAPIHNALKKRKYKDAIKLIGEDRPFMPSNLNLYALRSLAHDGLDQLEQALADIEVFLKSAPEPNVSHLLHHAALLSRLHRQQDAMVAAHKAVKLAPNLKEAFDPCFGWLAGFELIEKAKHAYQLTARALLKQCSEQEFPDIEGNVLNFCIEHEKLRLTQLSQSTPHLSSAVQEIKQFLDTCQKRLENITSTGPDEKNI